MYCFVTLQNSDPQPPYFPQPAPDALACPETHFQCPDHGYCLPAFVRCNGVNDCPGSEDEHDCDGYTCPGYYRCRGSKVCLHPDHLCDKDPQCPQSDDEEFCDMACSQQCVCYGLAFTCTQYFDAAQYPHLRYLDASDSGMTPGHLWSNTMLVHLRLARCGLTQSDSLVFRNLNSLDLSENLIISIDKEQLRHMPRLRSLILSGNPMTSLFTSRSTTDWSFPFLRDFVVTNLLLQEIDFACLTSFSHLQTLNLSFSGVTRVAGQGFRNLSDLRALDLSGCPLTTFPQDMLKDLRNLETVHAHNYKICCSQTLPAGFNVKNCHAPQHIVSSCDSLLGSTLHRVTFSVLAGLALLGNLGSFITRRAVLTKKTVSTCDVLVSHLTVSDFVMGVYLATVGIADQAYRGVYLWKEEPWRRSATCSAAGVLSLISLNVSTGLICVLSLDRCIALRFPQRRSNLSITSAHKASSVVWIAALALAVVPLLLPGTTHWELYSQSGLCLLLPVTTKSSAGHDFCLGVTVVLNVVLLLVTSVGHLHVHVYLRSQDDFIAAFKLSSRQLQEGTVARRVSCLVVFHVLCWLPVCLAALLTSVGVLAIPDEMNVTLLVLTLPLRSAINPLLYVLGCVQERRRQVQSDRLLKWFGLQAKD